MTVALAIASIAAFALALWVTGVARVGADALSTAQRALAVLRDSTLDDTSREKAVQQASLRLMGAFASLLLRGAAVLGAAALPIWLGSLAGLADSDKVVRYLSSWPVILVSSLALTAAFLLWPRRWLSR